MSTGLLGPVGVKFNGKDFNGESDVKYSGPELRDLF